MGGSLDATGSLDVGGGTLTQTEADALYASLAGDTFTGDVIFDDDAIFGKSPWFDIRKFGAVDGAGDNTSAIQAAITAAEAVKGTVFIPVGTWNVTGLTVNAAITLRGASRTTSILQTASGDLFTLGATASCSLMRAERMKLVSQSGGGHIFVQLRDMSRCVFEDLNLSQTNDAKSYWYNNDSGIYIDIKWVNIDATHTDTATIAGFYILSSAANRNQWDNSRYTSSGDYVIHIETTSATAYARDNELSDLTMEATLGGAIRLKGCSSTQVRNVGIYDVGGATKHQILMDYSGTLATRNTTVTGVNRSSGTLGVGVFDVQIAGSVPSVTNNNVFINCGGNTPLLIDAGSHHTIVIGGNYTLSNGGGTIELRTTGTEGLKLSGGSLYGDTATIKGAFDHDGTTFGAYGVAPATRPTAYTQTYATATKTNANPTAAALTVSDGAGTNDGTIGAITADASVIAAVQELAAQINKLIADVANNKQLINSVIDDGQILGLLQ